jgi:peptide deformylase
MPWKPSPAPFRKFKKEVYEKNILVSEFIYQIGEYPELRVPSKEISLDRITSIDTQNKFEYLKECLLRYRKLTGYGRGISAVQVGIPERFSVVYYQEKLLFIVDPKITKRSERNFRYSEICMSAFPIIAPVVRPAWIEFTYFDEKGNKQQWNEKDDSPLGKMMNRVFQHEIDHMDGIINIDKIVSPKELILESDPSFYDEARFDEV